MIELVAERGLAGVTVRRLSALAGVSTSKFYNHFDNTEECFAATYDFVMSCALERAVNSTRAPHHDWEASLRAGLDRLMRQIADHPKAAQLALVDVFSGGPAMLTRMTRALAGFERVLGEGFATRTAPAVAPPRIVKGIVAGAARVIRTRLLAGRAAELPAVSEELADWMLSFRRVAPIEGVGGARPVTPEPYAVSAGGPELNDADARPTMTSDEHARILAAVAKLGVREGYWNLTVPKIRVEAGVSRRNFDAQFNSTSQCFLEAVESLTVGAVVQAEEEANRAKRWDQGVYRAVLKLCSEISRNPVVAQLGFVDVFAPGRDGLRCRERLVDTAAERLHRLAPAGQRPTELASEASMAAAWRAVHDEIAAGNLNHLCRVAPTVAYLILAPTTSIPVVMQAIERETSHLAAGSRDR